MTPTFPPSAKELPFGVAILHHFKGGLSCFREFGDDLQVCKILTYFTWVQKVVTIYYEIH